MALTNMGLKTKNWSHVGEEQTVNRGKERRREEEEEEEKRKKEIKQKGMKLTLGTNFCMNFHTIAWLFVVPKPRVC